MSPEYDNIIRFTIFLIAIAFSPFVSIEIKGKTENCYNNVTT
jgi:hypothetical protein